MGVGEIRLLKPLFRRHIGIARGEDLRDRRVGLVKCDDLATPGEIVAHEVRNELDETLAIALDLRFERFGQDRVGDHQHQNRGHPTRDQDGDDDIEALETPARPAPQFVLLLHDFDPTARSVFGCFAGEATGDFMPGRLRTAGLAQRAGDHQSSISANSIRMWGARRSPSLVKLPRRDPSLRSIRRVIARPFRWRFDLTQPAEAASCRLCAP